MADDSKLPNIGGNGFVWILLVVAGTFFVTRQLPLEGSRPASTEHSLLERAGEQHVDARLWQDPFAAVADALTKSPELKPENCNRSDAGYKDIETYCRPPLQAARGAPDLTLLVSVSGTPYAEDQEARRRQRYAVLAGLDAEGFVPEDPQHIGFYWPYVPPPPPPSLMVRLVAAPADASAVQVPVSPPAHARRLPKVVPYEWFERRPERAKTGTGYQRILLLWFDEEALAAPAPAAPTPGVSAQAVSADAQPRRRRTAPLKQFGELLCPYLRHQDESKDTVKILGPQLSTTLKAVVDEIEAADWSKEDWSSGACRGSRAPPFYVSQATVSDDILLSSRSMDRSCLASNTCLSAFFDQEKSIRLYRLTATDDALASAIGEELRLRGIGRPGPIGWLYARFETLVETVGAKLGLHGGSGQDRRGPLALASKWYAGYEARIKEIGNKLGLRRHGHIALISEWDTLYGRALPDTMARCLAQSPCERVGDDPFHAKDWLHPFKYLRGLDGQMPDVGGLGFGSNAKDAGSKQDKDSKNSVKSPPDPSVKDRAEGQGQFDYLRRLGDRIQQLDAQLRRDGEQGIEAVGVLGSDLYDKLLVLQALRPLLPDSWFFTTDLDALLLNPSAQTRTRNLLVASSFGLQLRPDIQREIPPFRGNYQTAEFLAARVAIHGDGAPNPCWSQSPLLFEIGSAREFQFATAAPRANDTSCKDALLDCAASGPGNQAPGQCTPPNTESRRDDHEDCRSDLIGCRLIQPIAAAMVPRASVYSALGLVAIGLGLILCMPASFKPLRHRALHGIDAFLRGAKSNRRLLGRGLATFAVLGVIIVLLGGFLYLGLPPLGDWLTRDGQPMTLALEGISVWPTIFLRLATLLLCIRLLLFSWQKLDDNMTKIAQDLHLGQTRQKVQRQRSDLIGDGPPWVRLARRCGYHLPDAAGIMPGGDVSRFWRRYVYQGRGTARLGRVAAGVVAMLVLWGILSLIFGNPHAPARGGTSFVLYGAITFLLFLSTLVLIFFVADATLLCWRLVRDCRTETAIWPAETLQEFSGRLHLPQEFLDDWIDLIFIAKRTKCINTLLYWPFLILALIVISHSPLLAKYGRSIPDLVAIGVAVLIVTACAVALRWAAEDSRAKARRRLNERLMAARAQDDGAQLASRLELLLRRVEEVRDGAFSPFSQQPLVRAMLLPLGSLGGTALLQYMLVPGFG